MYEADRNEIVESIDNLIATIETRLLPTFNGLEEEAKSVADNRLEELAKQYGGAEDPSPYYEDAYDTGAEHYQIYTEMKNDFLNMSTAWLFHLFEQDCNRIFHTNDGSVRKTKLTALSIATTQPSNYYKINKELRLICNVTKHGDGDSQVSLLKIRPDLFDSETKPKFMNNPSTITHTLKNVSLVQIKEYAEYMKSFWIELYEAIQLKKSM